MIWICKPVPAYPERWGIRDTVIKEEVLPLAAQVAKETGVQVIDLYAPLSGKPKLFPDKIHPNAAGAGMIAGEVCKALTGKAPMTTPTEKRPAKPGQKTPATAP